LLAVQPKMAWGAVVVAAGRAEAGVFASYDSRLGGEDPPGRGAGNRRHCTGDCGRVGLDRAWPCRALVGPLSGPGREGGLVRKRTPHHAAGATEARVAERGAGTLPERAVDGRGGMGLTSGATLTVVSGLARGNGEEVVTTLF